MPNFPIVDTHMHLWDPSRLRYSWLDDLDLLNRPYLVEDFQAACGSVEVEAMVFVECDIDPSPDGRATFQEIDVVMGEVERDPRIRAVVPSLPFEEGPAAIEPMLREFRDRYPLVRGFRRLIQSMQDAPATLSSETFLDSIRLLGSYGYHFEICSRWDQLDAVIDFVHRAPDVSFVLDHCGKPGIREGHLAPYVDLMGSLSRRQNVICKLSGLAVESPAPFRPEDIASYVSVVLSTFGQKRLLFGGDWPVSLQAVTYGDWVSCIDECLKDLSPTDARWVYRDHAWEFYSLGR